MGGSLEPEALLLLGAPQPYREKIMSKFQTPASFYKKNGTGSPRSLSAGSGWQNSLLTKIDQPSSKGHYT